MTQHIAVMGVGAIGGIIGGYLTRAGRDVTLIDAWPANIEQIKSHGLTITAQQEKFVTQPTALHIGEVSAIESQFDLVFLCVKSYDTQWTTKFIQPYLATNGFIISAQNSINEDSIASMVGWPRVMGLVITLGAAMYEPGHAERTSSVTRLAFKPGEPSGIITDRAMNLSKILEDVGRSQPTTNLWGERWAKLATNSMSNALAAITGLKSAELRQEPSVRSVQIRIAGELVKVATTLGIVVEPIGGVSAQMFQAALTNNVNLKEIECKMLESANDVGTGRPSLAQDMIKGRKTEVDYLNGYVVKKGIELGVPTPVNESVVTLTKRIETNELEPSISNLIHI